MLNILLFFRILQFLSLLVLMLQNRIIIVLAFGDLILNLDQLLIHRQGIHVAEHRLTRARIEADLILWPL